MPEPPQERFAWAIDESTDGGHTWQWNQNTVTNWGAAQHPTPEDAASSIADRFHIDADRRRVTRIRVWPWTGDRCPTYDQIQTLAANTEPGAERSTQRAPAGDGHPHHVHAELIRRATRRDDGAIVGHGTCARCLQPVQCVYRPGLPDDQQEEAGWKLVDDRLTVEGRVLAERVAS